MTAILPHRLHLGLCSSLAIAPSPAPSAAPSPGPSHGPSPGPSAARAGAAHGAGTAQARRGESGIAPSAPCPPVSPGGHGRTRPPAGTDGAPHGADRTVARRAHGAPVDARFVVHRLEEAGRAMLALPNTGYSTRLRTSALDILHDAGDKAGWPKADTGGRLRPAMPDAATITRMDEALGWIKLIPPDKLVLRRLVGARSLVNPTTDKHLFAWRRLATMLGADHKAIQRWHAQGIDLIVRTLNAAR